MACPLPIHFEFVRLGSNHLHPVKLPSPFAWCKTFNAGYNSRIYQVLLGCVFRICQELDERQHGVNSSQSFNKIYFIVVVYNTPKDLGHVVANGTFLGNLNVAIRKQYQVPGPHLHPELKS